MVQPTVRVALLDMNAGTKNLGVGSIVDILNESSSSGAKFDTKIFDVRVAGEVPDLSFDVYISTGGPGSPFAGRGKPWEKAYFNWLDALWSHNQRAASQKHALFICHSFEMACHHFGLAKITRRKSPSFGIFPVHKERNSGGEFDAVLDGLTDPFLGADFRKWQAIDPDLKRFTELDASVIALEKIRPHIPLERAIMGVRIGEALVGLQFHPEAAPSGMRRHFEDRSRRKNIVDEHGLETYQKMIRLLEAPSELAVTKEQVIPNFLRQATCLSTTARQ